MIFKVLVGVCAGSVKCISVYTELATWGPKNTLQLLRVDVWCVHVGVSLVCGCVPCVFLCVDMSLVCGCLPGVHVHARGVNWSDLSECSSVVL